MRGMWYHGASRQSAEKTRNLKVRSLGAGHEEQEAFTETNSYLTQEVVKEHNVNLASC